MEWTSKLQVSPSSPSFMLPTVTVGARHAAVVAAGDRQDHIAGALYRVGAAATAIVRSWGVVGEVDVATERGRERLTVGMGRRHGAAGLREPGQEARHRRG